MASDPSTPNSQPSVAEEQQQEEANPVEEQPVPPRRRVPFLIDPRHLLASGQLNAAQLIQPAPVADPPVPVGPLPVVSSPAAAVPVPGPIRTKQVRGPRGPYKKKEPQGGVHYHITNNLNFHPNMDADKIVAVVRALQDDRQKPPSP